jgi:pimeloyl-ACP methyl ester carboxylesterase
MACLRQRQASVSYDARNRLGDIRVPALILHGRRNRSMPVALAERMHAGIRDSRIELFCGGHIIFLFAERQQFVDRTVVRAVGSSAHIAPIWRGPSDQVPTPTGDHSGGSGASCSS